MILTDVNDDDGSFDCSIFSTSVTETNDGNEGEKYGLIVLYAIINRVMVLSVSIEKKNRPLFVSCYSLPSLLLEVFSLANCNAPILTTCSRMESSVVEPVIAHWLTRRIYYIFHPTLR